MIAHGSTAPRGLAPRRSIGLALCSALWLVAHANAQTVLGPVPATDLATGQSAVPAASAAVSPTLAGQPEAGSQGPAQLPAALIPASAPETGVVQTGCQNCGSGLFGLPSSPPPQPGGNGCACSSCVPGRPQCHACYAQSGLGRMICGIYECICCPDHCYEGRWLPIADSAFFTDAVRPVTQQRFRWDHGVGLILPDRNEYFWARADGQGEGPTPQAPFKVAPRLNYDELSLYTETAVGGVFSIIVEMPYRSQEPIAVSSSVGFGDITLGTKTLMFDCELLQIGLEMKTTLQSGNFLKGLGRSLLSLEPSLLIGLKLAPDTHFQGQISEWVPLGGDPDYAGCILHFHGAINQVLWRVLPDVPLIGTLEMSAWAFQDGAYTDPILGSFQRSSGEVYVMPGLGLRLFVCNKIDFGISAAFAVTDRHWAEQLYRSEFRFRF